MAAWASRMTTNDNQTREVEVCLELDSGQNYVARNIGTQGQHGLATVHYCFSRYMAMCLGKYVMYVLQTVLAALQNSNIQTCISHQERTEGSHGGPAEGNVSRAKGAYPSMPLPVDAE